MATVIDLEKYRRRKIGIVDAGEAATDIVYARNAAGLSVREAASIVGVSARTWMRWEKGVSPIPYAHWSFFLLAVGRHPNFVMQCKRDGTLLPW